PAARDRRPAGVGSRVHRMGVRARQRGRGRFGRAGDGGGAGGRRQCRFPSHRPTDAPAPDDAGRGDGAVIRPTTLEDAVRAGRAVWVYRAGGTDILASRRQGLQRGEAVDLPGIPGLVGVQRRDDGVRIGALTRIADVASDPLVAGAYPALALTAASLATPQIRAVGTVGGNPLERNRGWKSVVEGRGTEEHREQ